MLKIEAKKNPETDRYHGEVSWAGWQVFICPNEYDHKQDALNEANRQFAGGLRKLLGL